ncbi:MAG: HDOD domain-containing protein [Candidatus Thiodiazotropha sp. (ex Lucinoma annulata)]|nr:HDOD domain-containing protein [Candidatus Thiodiazotropha sp. (ex Lucinoma borealis)]MCU7841291.1 HDOD domain-containing protein [Candidatus Thiodiazotropha sp. (ex Troendleina suluensis)]MCU7862784.1 HDOD domain-containing protein [Candidatus Thiodiazotropha sp. (ex Lucinoma borealis)]MCU7868333.1 HDOD domain-containing protein [Candidatus Thiodiazotropha sp. (ex Lucinoma borealis)]MCU7883734.1 HDOD domain-containing protein [Candidatus Thiodiazotropha sp. (ex Lucinoma annulata)]
MSKSVFFLSDGAPVDSETEEERERKRLEASTTKAFVDAVREDLRANNIYLPTLPALALEALVIINDVDSSASDLEKVISRDAALTARLIRYANSPLYRGLNTIASIRPAITRIGFQRVKNAVYAVSMKEVFRTSEKVIEKRMDKLWTHSVRVGAQAAMLAKEQPGLDPDVALVAGLVHDIGHIPLLIKACDYKELISNPDYLDKVLQKLHPQLGGSILKLWKFDQHVIDVAAEHEDLDRDPGDAPIDYVDVVQVANITVHEGTEHPLATIDRSTIKAFSRLKQSGEESGLDEETKKVEDAIF